MTRGGRAKDRSEPERRCAVTGAVGGTADLIRFVLSPDGVVTPDVAEKLPGRGVWVTADRATLAQAVKRNAFARSLRRAVVAPEDLVEQTELLLAKQTIAAISLARKAGIAVAGFEKAKAAAPDAATLIQASDGAPDGLRKMRRLIGAVPVLQPLKKEELGLAFGRLYVIHAVLMAGGATARVLREASRLQGFRKAAASFST